MAVGCCRGIAKSIQQETGFTARHSLAMFRQFYFVRCCLHLEHWGSYECPVLLGCGVSLQDSGIAKLLSPERGRKMISRFLPLQPKLSLFQLEDNGLDVLRWESKQSNTKVTLIISVISKLAASLRLCGFFFLSSIGRGRCHLGEAFDVARRGVGKKRKETKIIQNI